MQRNCLNFAYPAEADWRLKVGRPARQYFGSIRFWNSGGRFLAPRASILRVPAHPMATFVLGLHAPQIHKIKHTLCCSTGSFALGLPPLQNLRIENTLCGSMGSFALGLGALQKMPSKERLDKSWRGPMGSSFSLSGCVFEGDACS